VRVIGVIDMLIGHAVHARGGRREQYEPVRTIAGAPVPPGNALALARGYLALGVRELYVADLDAILGLSTQDAMISGLVSLGVPLWIDAGVTSIDRARHVLGLGATRVIVGLETLTSYEALGEMCNVLGGDRITFSLDLRNGQPILAPRGQIAAEPAHQVAARAAAAGVGAMIVIDLARVGTGAGMDSELIARTRQASAGVTLLAGGGVRHMDDLRDLARCGCDGALVATALHDGRITAKEVAAGSTLKHVRSAAV
jgi:phosphoribosylformimino-5-aminoimidazole carboxamide ribotide isomerase